MQPTAPHQATSLPGPRLARKINPANADEMDAVMAVAIDLLADGQASPDGTPDDQTWLKVQQLLDLIDEGPQQPQQAAMSLLVVDPPPEDPDAPPDVDMAPGSGGDMDDAPPKKLLMMKPKKGGKIRRKKGYKAKRKK